LAVKPLRKLEFTEVIETKHTRFSKEALARRKRRMIKLLQHDDLKTTSDYKHKGSDESENPLPRY